MFATWLSFATYQHKIYSSYRVIGREEEEEQEYRGDEEAWVNVAEHRRPPFAGKRVTFTADI